MFETEVMLLVANVNEHKQVKFIVTFILPT